MNKFNKNLLIIASLLPFVVLLSNCTEPKSMISSSKNSSLSDFNSLNEEPVDIVNGAATIGEIMDFRTHVTKVLKNSDVVVINHQKYSIGALKSIAKNFDKIFKLGENEVITLEGVNKPWGNGTRYISNKFEEFVIKNYPNGAI